MAVALRMRLRLILLVLALLAFLSASIGGLLYYSALKESAFKEADRQALSRLEMIQKNLTSYISENIKPVRAMAGISSFFAYLASSLTRLSPSSNEYSLCTCRWTNCGILTPKYRYRIYEIRRNCRI